jgi:DHA1 family bicyclomycin/chloramphenicol resistance-like MFS transporter
MVFALAPVLAPTLGALLLQLGSWRWLFVFLAVFGLACIAASFVLPETLTFDRRSDHGVVNAAKVYGSLIRDPRFLPPAILAGSTYVVLFAYISTSPAVMLDFFGMDELGFALLFGFLSLCFALGAQLNSRLLKRFDVIPLIVGFVILQLVAALVLLIDAIAAPSLFVVSVSIGVAMATIGVISANSTALCLDPFPRAAGSAAALLGLIGMSVGAVVSSTLVAINLPVVTELGTTMLLGAGVGILTLPFVARRRIPEAATTNATPSY